MVAPSVSRQYQLVFNNKNWYTNIQGTTPEFLAIRNFNVESGMSFSTQDLNTRARVAVLGKTTADNLFGDIDPIGQTIRINKRRFAWLAY
jgi:putative ABC transport system permease protein